MSLRFLSVSQYIFSAVSSPGLIVVSFWSTVQRCNERLLLVTEPDVNIDDVSLG